MTTSKPRPVCVHCRAKYGSRQTAEQRVKWKAGEPMPAYSGGAILVGKKEYQNHPDLNGGEARGAYHVWDGVSWFGGYPPFCTLRCALDYARKSYKARAKL
jgi:hypothetical protein